MLNLLKRKLDARLVPLSAPDLDPGPALLDERPELRVRDLLDDPGLRRAMGLDTTALPSPTATAVPLAFPAPRFDRRRLLHEAAA